MTYNCWGVCGKWSGLVAVGTRLFAAPYRAPRMLVVETHPAVEASSISTEGIYSGEYRWDGITAVSEDIALRTPFGSRLQGSIVGKQVKTTRNKTLRSKQTPKKTLNNCIDID